MKLTNKVFITLLAFVIFWGCNSQRIVIDGQPSKFSIKEQPDGSCTVTSVVKIKMDGKAGSMLLKSNKPTCDEAKADIIEGIKYARENN